MITTHLDVVHLGHKVLTGETVSQEKMGVGKEGDNREGPRLYMGSDRATKLRRRVTAELDG